MALGNRTYESRGYEAGFTLLELLLVVVILGVLAATVLLGLGGVTSQADQAACNSDAKNVQIAAEAFHDNSSNTAAGGQFPTSASELTEPASDNYGGPYLHTWPASTQYVITLDPAGDGQVDVNGHDYDGSLNPCSSVA
jgi:prepilin-type N-terminal cleavage/methylation domain-containing protein